MKCVALALVAAGILFATSASPQTYPFHSSHAQSVHGCQQGGSGNRSGRGGARGGGGGSGASAAAPAPGAGGGGGRNRTASGRGRGGGSGAAAPGAGGNRTASGGGHPNRAGGGGRYGGSANATSPGRGNRGGGNHHRRRGEYGGNGRPGGVGNGRPRPPDWNRPPRNWNRDAYRRNVKAPRRWHWGVYTRPPGWFYRRWAYGMILPSLFWTRNFWIEPWWAFDLVNPPYGYQWVRVENDALLVNTATGEILQVQYDVFY